MARANSRKANRLTSQFLSCWATEHGHLGVHPWEGDLGIDPLPILAQAHAYGREVGCYVLNVAVYVTTEGAALRKDGDNLVADVEGTERARVPFHMLSSLVVFGGIFISPPLIEALRRAA